MKVITVDNLKEGEVLAKDVLLPDYTVLLGKGTQIKQEYINKLKEYFIVTVYIEEASPEEIEADRIIDEVIKEVEYEEIKNDNNTKAEKKETKKEEPVKKENNKKEEQKVEENKLPDIVGYIPKRNDYELNVLKKDIEEKIQLKLGEYTGRHYFQNTYGLEEIAKGAKIIIDEVLKNKAVIDKVYDVRERDANVYEHSITVCTLSILVAIKLDLNKDNIIDIAVAALLHDLGFRYLSRKYEKKDIYLLPRMQKDEYKKHGLYAYTSLKEEKWITPNAKEIILGHHEKKNGQGYPFNRTDLAKDCQILGVCDEFDEMICGIGKAKVRVHEAIACIRNYSGVWYDDEIVEAFLGLVAVYPVGIRVITNLGQIGIVIKQNNNCPERPIIKILEDKLYKNIAEPIDIDLSKSTRVIIEEVLV